MKKERVEYDRLEKDAQGVLTYQYRGYIVRLGQPIQYHDLDRCPFCGEEHIRKTGKTISWVGYDDFELYGCRVCRGAWFESIGRPSDEEVVSALSWGAQGSCCR